MQIIFHKSFKKEFKKLSSKTQGQFDQRFLLFCNDHLNPILNCHELSGELAGVYSMNVTGDIRAQFYYQSSDHIIFIHIGSHSQLY